MTATITPIAGPSAKKYAASGETGAESRLGAFREGAKRVVEINRAADGLKHTPSNERTFKSLALDFERSVHAAHLTLITIAMAALDFDDPLLLGILSIGAATIVLFPLIMTNPTGAVVVVLIFVVVLAGMYYTTYRITRQDHWARQFESSHRELREEFEQEDGLGPASTPESASPPRQHARNASLDTLMMRARELGKSFEVDVLEPVRARASASSGQHCSCAGHSLKARKRSKTKTATEYGGDFCRLLDLLRGAIVCEKMEGVVSCFVALAELEDAGVLRIVRIKNRYRDGGIEGSGYCDANVNVEYQEHICEVQFQLKLFSQHKKQAHSVYKIARSLNLQGGIREIPKTTSISWAERCMVTLMLLLSVCSAIFQAVMYRYLHWAAWGEWNGHAEGLAADVWAAVLCGSFLLVCYLCLERMIRPVQERSLALAAVLQVLCILGIFGLYAVTPELFLERQVPQIAAGWDMHYVVSRYYVHNPYEVSALDAGIGMWRDAIHPRRDEGVAAISILPYLVISSLFARDFYRSMRGGRPARRRSRVGLIFDKYVQVQIIYLGTNGTLFEWRILVQQSMTVALQSFTKVPQLGSAAWSAKAILYVLWVPFGKDGEEQESLAMKWFWVVVVALVLNAFYPFLLLCVRDVNARRNVAMFLDSAFDVVYGPATAMLLHSIGLTAAAFPSGPVRFVSNFWPTFHIFTLACGLELGALQRSARAKAVKQSEAEGTVRRTSVDDRLDLIREGRSNVPPWWAASLFTLSGLCALSVSVGVLCGDRYPLAVDDVCQPCRCDEANVVLTCEAVTDANPQFLQLVNKGITGIAPGAFDPPEAYSLLQVFDIALNPLNGSLDSVPSGMQRIFVDNTDINDDSVESLARTIKAQASDLRHFTAFYSPIRDRGAVALANEVIAHRPKLETLQLMETFIDKDGAQAVASAIKMTPNLDSYYMGGGGVFSRITLGHEVMLAQLKSFPPSMTEISLMSHLRGDEAPEIIEEVALQIREAFTRFVSPTLIVFGLNPSLGDAGALAFAAGMAGKRGLKSFAYVYNGCGVEGAKAIANMIVDQEPFEKLFMNYNFGLGPDGAVALAAALSTRKHLSHVYLHHDSIKDEGAVALAAALNDEHKSFVSLKIGTNLITDVGATALAQGFKRVRTSLKLIWLDNNMIGDDGAKALAEAFTQMHSLLRVNLEFNQIGDEGALAIADALADKEHLHIVALWNNTFGEGTRVLLQERLRHVPKLLLTQPS